MQEKTIIDITLTTNRPLVDKAFLKREIEEAVRDQGLLVLDKPIIKESEAIEVEACQQIIQKEQEQN